MSETGLVYTFTTPKLQPLVTKPEGKNLIQVRYMYTGRYTSVFKITLLTRHRPQACLNAPEPASNENGIEGDNDAVSPEEHQQSVGGQRPGMVPASTAMPPNYGMTPEQALQYQSYLQQQQQQAGAYPVTAQAGQPLHR